MKSFDEIFDIISPALLADPDITAWCQDKYEKALTVYFGGNEQCKPGLDHCPFIMILPEKMRGGNEVDTNSTQMSLVFGIKNENLKIDGEEWKLRNAPKNVAGKVVRFAGTSDVSNFWKLIWDVLRKLNEPVISRFVGDIDQFGDHPLYVGGVTLEMDETKTLGSW